MSANKPPKSPIDKESMGAFSRFLVGVENQKIVDEGNSFLMKGRVVCEEDVRYQQWVQHLVSLGVDVSAYGVNANALSYAYSPELPDFGRAGEIKEMVTGNKEANQPSIVLTGASTQSEKDGEEDK